MPPSPAPKEYPYIVVAVLEIYYDDAGTLKKWVGTGYLVQTPTHTSRNIMLTAAHNLVYLRKPVQEVLVTLYNDRDVNSIATRANGTFRYAIPEGYDHDPSNPAFDFAVMILQEAADPSRVPLTLTIVGDTLVAPANIAGGLSTEVQKGNRTIYRSAVDVQKQKNTPLFYPADATEKGMSGGPVIFEAVSTWNSLGVVTGTGDMNGTLQGIAAPIFAETATIIDQLIATSLAG